MSARVEVYREDISGIEVPRQYRRADFLPKPVWGGWRWRYVAPNGRIMADGSQAYARRIDCLNGCATVLGGEVDKVAPESIFRVRWDLEARSSKDEYEGEDILVVDLTREAKP